MTVSRDLCFMGNECTRKSEIEKNVAFTNLRIVVTRVWLYLLFSTSIYGLTEIYFQRHQKY